MVIGYYVQNDMGMSQLQETLEGGWISFTRENRAMRLQAGKEDQNERYKPMMSLLEATGWLLEDQLRKSESRFIRIMKAVIFLKLNIFNEYYFQKAINILYSYKYSEKILITKKKLVHSFLQKCSSKGATLNNSRMRVIYTSSRTKKIS